MPVSSKQAYLHLHDVYEHAHDYDLPFPFYGHDYDHGRNDVCVHDYVLLHRMRDHRVCGRGCDPRYISSKNVLQQIRYDMKKYRMGQWCKLEEVWN